MVSKPTRHPESTHAARSSSSTNNRIAAIETTKATRHNAGDSDRPSEKTVRCRSLPPLVPGRPRSLLVLHVTGIRWTSPSSADTRSRLSTVSSRPLNISSTLSSSPLVQPTFSNPSSSSNIISNANTNTKTTSTMDHGRLRQACSLPRQLTPTDTAARVRWWGAHSSDLLLPLSSRTVLLSESNQILASDKIKTDSVLSSAPSQLSDGSDLADPADLALQLTITYHVCCSLKQFTTYLADMGSLEIEILHHLPIRSQRSTRRDIVVGSACVSMELRPISASTITNTAPTAILAESATSRTKISDSNSTDINPRQSTSLTLDSRCHDDIQSNPRDSVGAINPSRSSSGDHITLGQLPATGLHSSMDDNALHLPSDLGANYIWGSKGNTQAKILSSNHQLPTPILESSLRHKEINHDTLAVPDLHLLPKDNYSTQDCLQHDESGMHGSKLSEWEKQDLLDNIERYALQLKSSLDQALPSAELGGLGSTNPPVVLLESGTNSSWNTPNITNEALHEDSLDYVPEMDNISHLESTLGLDAYSSNESLERVLNDDFVIEALKTEAGKRLLDKRSTTGVNLGEEDSFQLSSSAETSDYHSESCSDNESADGRVLKMLHLKPTSATPRANSRHALLAESLFSYFKSVRSCHVILDSFILLPSKQKPDTIWVEYVFPAFNQHSPVKGRLRMRPEAANIKQPAAYHPASRHSRSLAEEKSTKGHDVYIADEPITLPVSFINRDQLMLLTDELIQLKLIGLMSKGRGKWGTGTKSTFRRKGDPVSNNHLSSESNQLWVANGIIRCKDLLLSKRLQWQGKVDFWAAERSRLPRPISGSAKTILSATSAYHDNISQRDPLSSHIGDMNMTVEFISEKSMPEAHVPLPTQVSPSALHLTTASDIPHTALAFTDEFLKAGAHSPIIAEIHAIRVANSSSTIWASEMRSRGKTNLVGLIRLPLPQLIAAVLSSKAHLDIRGSGDDDQTPILIPDTEYAILDPFAGTAKGWVTAFMAVGTWSQINHIRQGEAKHMVSANTPEDTAITLPTMQIGNACSPIPTRDPPPGLDAEVSIPLSLHKQHHDDSSFEASRPCNDQDDHDDSGVLPDCDTVPAECCIEVGIHSACGILGLLRCLPSDFSGITDEALQLAKEVGADVFVTLVLFPEDTDFNNTGLNGNEHSIDTMQDPSIICTQLVPKTFSPVYHHQVELTVCGLDTDLISWIRSGGTAHGKIWHRVPSHLSPTGISKDILLGTFLVPLDALLLRKSGIHNQWVYIQPVSSPVDTIHDPSRASSSLNGSSGAIAAVQISVRFRTGMELGEFSDELDRSIGIHDASVIESPITSMKLAIDISEVDLADSDRSHYGDLDLSTARMLIRWKYPLVQIHAPLIQEVSNDLGGAVMHIRLKLDVMRTSKLFETTRKEQIAHISIVKTPVAADVVCNASLQHSEISSLKPSTNAFLVDTNSGSVEIPPALTVQEESRISIHISVERATHLPLMDDPFADSMVSPFVRVSETKTIPPNSFVAFSWPSSPLQFDGERTDYQSRVIGALTNPTWCYQTKIEVSRTRRAVNILKTEVNEETKKDLIGIARVAFHPLFGGMSEINGWYPVKDASGAICGQLMECNTLQPVHSVDTWVWTGRKWEHRQVKVQSPATEDVNPDDTPVVPAESSIVVPSTETCTTLKTKTGRVVSKKSLTETLKDLDQLRESMYARLSEISHPQHDAKSTATLSRSIPVASLDCKTISSSAPKDTQDERCGVTCGFGKDDPTLAAHSLEEMPKSSDGALYTSVKGSAPVHSPTMVSWPIHTSSLPNPPKSIGEIHSEMPTMDIKSVLHVDEDDISVIQTPLKTDGATADFIPIAADELNSYTVRSDDAKSSNEETLSLLRSAYRIEAEAERVLGKCVTVNMDKEVRIDATVDVVEDDISECSDSSQGRADSGSGVILFAKRATSNCSEESLELDVLAVNENTDDEDTEIGELAQRSLRSVVSGGNSHIPTNRVLYPATGSVVENESPGRPELIETLFPKSTVSVQLHVPPKHTRTLWKSLDSNSMLARSTSSTSSLIESEPLHRAESSSIAVQSLGMGAEVDLTNSTEKLASSSSASRSTTAWLDEKISSLPQSSIDRMAQVFRTSTLSDTTTPELSK
ncbi:hypothetical protein BSLG_003311 [Batrachochytrium salamandrivorans]|nr:hypothetical protein BSLG_003311 [Batrachochytrium salamandrivorans]